MVRVSQRFLQEVSWMYQKSFKGFSRRLHGYFLSVSRNFQGIAFRHAGACLTLNTIAENWKGMKEWHTLFLILDVSRVLQGSFVLELFCCNVVLAATRAKGGFSFLGFLELDIVASPICSICDGSFYNLTRWATGRENIKKGNKDSILRHR